VQRRLKNIGNSGWLFEDRRGEQYTQHDFSTYVYNLMPYSVKQGALVCPVTHWTPHNLRRTSRTMLASIGCPSEIAEAIVGHLPTVIEATYNSHSYDNERLHWLTKLAHHLDQLGNSQEAADQQ
jgi:integrase